MNPSDPLQPFIFIASGGKWHVTTQTYWSGAKTKCGLEGALGFIVAINPMGPPVKTYRQVAHEHGRIEDAGAPDCETCFFGPKRVRTAVPIV